MATIDSLKGKLINKLKQAIEFLDEIPKMPRPLALNEVRTGERIATQIAVGFEGIVLYLVSELSAEDHEQWAEEERFSGKGLGDDDPRTSRN